MIAINKIGLIKQLRLLNKLARKRFEGKEDYVSVNYTQRQYARDREIEATYEVCVGIYGDKKEHLGTFNSSGSYETVIYDLEFKEAQPCV